MQLATSKRRKIILYKIKIKLNHWSQANKGSLFIQWLTVFLARFYV